MRRRTRSKTAIVGIVDSLEGYILENMQGESARQHASDQNYLSFGCLFVHPSHPVCSLSANRTLARPKPQMVPMKPDACSPATGVQSLASVPLLVRQDYDYRNSCG